MFEFIEKSFFIQNWEVFALILGVLFIISKFRRQDIPVETRKLSDEERIANDYQDDEVNEVDLTPSLEICDHVPFSGATKFLNGGAEEFYDMANDRRSIRSFSSDPIDIEIVKKCIAAAGTSPSGAHTEPWSFCLIQSADMKSQIREIIEQEEYVNYEQRMSRQWTTDLKPLKTNHIKEYLTDAPYLILVFKQTYGMLADGRRKTHYYNEISTAISVGILLSALQAAGLSSLTTTPLNCGPVLRKLLNRPINEKLLVLLPVGYPSRDCEIPNLKRKSLNEIMTIY